MKSKLSLLFFSLLTILFFTCSSDDTPSEAPDDTSGDITIDPGDSESISDDILNGITNNGDIKVWKIESATLTNNSVNNLDVTNAFNIKDDEFRFYTENNNLHLEHRQRHEFNKNAPNYQSFLLENYRSALNYVLINDVDTPMGITTENNTLTFNYQSNSLISGVWMIANNTTLNFELSIKTAADYPSIPTNLSFEEVIEIPNSYNFHETNGASAEVIASQSNNSLYLINTTNVFDNPNGGINRTEGVVHYDINTNQLDHHLFHNVDHYTKRAVISNNKLKVIGSQYINTYNDLNSISGPFSSLFYNNQTTHNYFRHDAVIYDELIYIMGGNAETDNPANYFNRVLTYNETTNDLNVRTTMPTPKAQAAMEVVDGKIYIFSGVQAFNEMETAETLSYIYDIQSNSFTEFDLPQSLSVSFATRVQNLIYVGGQVRVLDPNNSNNALEINPYLGVYNTEDNSFTEITHNLESNNDTLSRIHGIAYNNNALYVVSGYNSPGYEEGEIKVYKAAL
jgi:hypothetical protein